jgi:branched-chain amino acid transport system permease protein
MQILMTTGIALILVDTAQLTFGADYHQTNIDLVNRAVHLGPFTLNAASLLSFAIATVFIVGLREFVVRSRTGQALRAIAQNRDVAPLMGINVTRIQGFSFALGIAFAGIAGGLLLPALYLFPSVGEDYTLKAFVIVVLGGMGSIEGAAMGGLVLGVAESLTSTYIGNQWALAIDFVLFLLMLSLKPSGIFGRQRA